MSSVHGSSFAEWSKMGDPIGEPGHHSGRRRHPGRGNDIPGRLKAIKTDPETAPSARRLRETRRNRGPKGKSGYDALIALLQADPHATVVTLAEEKKDEVLKVLDEIGVRHYVGNSGHYFFPLADLAVRDTG